MEKAFILNTVTDYLSKEFYCPKVDLESDSTVLTMNRLAKVPYIKIMTFHRSTVICTSEELHQRVKNELSGKSRDEIFEFPFVYGQTIHFVPDVNKINLLPLPKDYTLELLWGEEIKKLNYIKGFDNSLVFDENGNTASAVVLAAKFGDEIVGIAGAAAEAEKMWEVGVDVAPPHRKSGLGTALVSGLTAEIIKKGIVPFYSASVTNISSQMVASRSGYIPFWVDSFGTTLDGSSVYNKFTSLMRI